MKTIKANWNLGNYNVSIAAKATPELEEKLLVAGLTQIGQRQSGIDEAMGAFIGEGKNKKRKEKWSRGDVAYSDDMANTLATIFSRLSSKAFEIEGLECTVNVEEYVREAAELKYRDERAMAKEVNAKGEGKLEAWLEAKIGYTGKAWADDGLDFSEEALKAIKAKVAEFKKMLAA